jgi:type I restriction enzyme S subunit
VPAHWDVKPLRWYADCYSGDGISPNNIEVDEFKGSVPVIGGNGIMGYTNQSNTNQSVIAIGRVGALCGNVHVLNEKVWISDNALVLDASKKSFNINFLALVLKSRNLNDIASKTAQPLITGTQLMNQRVPAPCIREQMDIIDFIHERISIIDTLIDKARQSIDLAKEHRTALISAAVTGKIDVREAA